MSYINFNVQCNFFQKLRERRRNREIYGAIIHPCFSSFLFFDPCLDMIACHHPDIWEYGTGNLLVAPKLCTNRALEWRQEAIDLKNNNIDKGFGYLARKTLEYRDSMRMYKYELEATNTILSDEHIERFEYIENLSYQIEDLGLKSEKTRRVGIQRFGILFDKDRDLSRYQNYFQIYNEIDECIQNPIPDVFQIETQIIEDMYNYDENNYESSEDESDYPVTVPGEFILSNQKQECVVCLEEKDVLEWPCHTTHVTCEECVLKILRFIGQVSCPICRKNI